MPDSKQIWRAVDKVVYSRTLDAPNTTNAHPTILTHSRLTEVKGVRGREENPAALLIGGESLLINSHHILQSLCARRITVCYSVPSLPVVLNCFVETAA